MEEFDFGGAEQHYTFNHVIALGDKANAMLGQLKIEFGSWFEDDLLTIKDGCEEVRHLIAIVDNEISLFDIPERYVTPNLGCDDIIVLDVGDKPQKKRWKGVFSYLWIPEENLYTTLRDFFKMYYHDALSMGSMICFDFNDWKLSVRGTNELTIYKTHLDANVMQRLSQWPKESTPNDKYVVIIGAPSTENEKMEDLLKTVNAFFDRFPSEAEIHWTLLGKTFSEQDAYISMMQFKPI